MLEKIKKELFEFKLLLKAVPSILLILFIVTVLAMNLLANKSINLGVDYLALDCGIIISWFAFLAMDMITKHFGPKGATQISILAIIINLLLCFIFYLGSIIPGTWGESFVPGSEDIINKAINQTFGGSWYVLLGSTTAFIVSAIVNNFLNFGIGKLFSKKPNSMVAYFSRSYISTAVGQFVDNFLFSLIVSHIFFGWSILACVTCSLTGMLVELICEVIFSYFGYKITNKWQQEGLGIEYFNYIKHKERKNLDENISDRK